MASLSWMMVPVLLIQLVLMGVGIYIAYLLIKALRIYIKKNKD